MLFPALCFMTLEFDCITRTSSYQMQKHVHFVWRGLDLFVSNKGRSIKYVSLFLSTSPLACHASWRWRFVTHTPKTTFVLWNTPAPPITRTYILNQVCRLFARHCRLQWCMVQSAFIFRSNSVGKYPKTSVAISTFNLISTARQQRKTGLLTNVTIAKITPPHVMLRNAYQDTPPLERDVHYGWLLSEVPQF